MCLWKELKLPLEDHILKIMILIDGGIADKTEDHIERIHQVGKRLKEYIHMLPISHNHKLHKLDFKIYHLILLLK